MYIVQDLVDLIVDQLYDPTDYYHAERYLQATSLVSTAWVNRSQHHLFSTLELFDSRRIKRWCSRIKPDPDGVSRHVRVLAVGCLRFYADPNSKLLFSDIKPAMPHLTSFKNLQEFVLGHTDLEGASLGVLAPLLSSSVGTLERLRWTHRKPDICETWKDIGIIANLLPNLTYIDLSGYQDSSSKIQIRLPADEGRSLAVKRFKFHEL